jgi:hypothetical protein
MDAALYLDYAATTPVNKLGVTKRRGSCWPWRIVLNSEQRTAED